ncbi:ABC transporter permease [Candidatus Omnitrophota bacterium]
MKALKYLIRKEFIQIRRTRSMIAISLGMPVIQLLLLGFAVSGDVEHVPTAVVDLDNSAASRNLASKLENSRYLDIRYRPADIRESMSLLRSGNVILSVAIPKDFERDLQRGEQPSIALLADAQNSNVAVTGTGYVKRIISSWGQQHGSYLIKRSLTASILKKNQPQINFSTLASRIWYNPELKSVYYMVPGIMAVLVTIITIMLTAMAIVREREQGTLEQIMVSPITRTELILGKTIPFALIGMIELAISMIVIRTVYHVPMHGSLITFFFISVLFISCTLGIGIFVSTITTTQQQAMFSAWFIMVFCILMSGFLLPLENIPEPLHTLTAINPVRYYLSTIRELFLKGAGFYELRDNIIALVIIGSFVLTASVSRFTKKIG